MDFSSEYIEMCTKAEEIQLLRREEHNSSTGKWQAGDFWTTVFNSDRGKAFVVPSYLDAWADLPHYIHHPMESIWLPRQDQLQAMLGEFNLVGFWQQFFSYQSYVVEEEVGFELPEWAGRCDSWEQLWLTLVMWRKCNKEWHEGEWIVP